METASQYEVMCPRCNVTFPVGTKVCMHCGGRTAASRVHAPDSPPRTREAAEQAIGRQRTMDEPHPIDLFEEEEEEVAAQGSTKMRALVTLIWILLAIGFSLARACNEG